MPRIVEPNLENGLCGFRLNRSTTDQIFHVMQIFRESSGVGEDLFACFVDLEKVYDRVSRENLRKVLREYGIDAQLLLAINSLSHSTANQRFVFG